MDLSKIVQGCEAGKRLAVREPKKGKMGPLEVIVIRNGFLSKLWARLRGYSCGSAALDKIVTKGTEKTYKKETVDRLADVLQKRIGILESRKKSGPFGRVFGSSKKIDLAVQKLRAFEKYFSNLVEKKASPIEDPLLNPPKVTPPPESNEEQPVVSTTSSVSVTPAYEASLTEKNKEDISFIVMLLSTEPSKLKRLAKINDLKNANGRLKMLPGLAFLHYIFTTPKLRQNIGKMEGNSYRGWNNVISDLSKNLNAKTPSDQEIEAFAKSLGFDSKFILPSAKAKKWEELVKALIQHAPMLD